MIATILLFAKARESANADSILVEVAPHATIGDLRRAAAQQHPKLAELLKVSMIAVNHEFAEDALPLPGDCEIAVIPPVSGGSIASGSIASGSIASSSITGGMPPGAASR